MNITQKVLENYNKTKVSDKTMGCSLIACENFGKNCAKMVIGSYNELDKHTIRSFVFSSTDHKLIPYTDSINKYRDDTNNYHYATVIAYKPSIRYKDALKASNTMTQINSNSFLDEELGNVWEKKDVNGKQYFVRSNDDNIEDVLEEAYLSSSASTKLAASVSNFNEKVKPGDYVKFFTFKQDTPGNAIGHITSASRDKVSVKTIKGKELTIPSHAIIAAVPEEQVDNVEDVVNWLKNALAPTEETEYRKQLDRMADE